MKLPSFATVLLLMCAALSSVAQPQEKKPEKIVDPKTKKEISKMEKALAEAIEAHDTDVLDSLLADYFADAYAESESGLSKAGAIKACKAGTLPSYRFVRSPQLSQSGEVVHVEGIAKERLASSNDNKPKDQFVRVRRVWTQKEGHWLLVAQVRENVEEDDAPSDKDQD